MSEKTLVQNLQKYKNINETSLHFICNLETLNMFPGFVHPFTCIIAGPTQSGKTYFLKRLLKALEFYIDPCPERIIWCFGIENKEQMSFFENCNLKVPIEFIEGLPIDIHKTISPKEKTLIILDDLMQEIGQNSAMSTLFTRQSHHKNLSVIFVVQNFFHQSKRMRDIHLSTNYIIFFKNPRDMSQIKVLDRQAFPN